MFASIAECVAATRFIPPEGALQFEVKLMRRPETKSLEGNAVWVKPSRQEGREVGERFCRCGGADNWTLILDSLPEGGAKNFLDGMRAQYASPEEVFDVTLCGCNGRIIE